MTKPVLLAGLLGGLLGGVFGFALTRALPATPKPPPTPPPSEARRFADDLMRLLKDGKNDEFMRLVRPAFAQMSDEQFARFRQSVVDLRADAAKSYGPGSEFEFFHETTLNSTLVRVTYIEKYARGCILWLVAVYNTPDGWQVTAFSFQMSESGFPLLR